MKKINAIFFDLGKVLVDYDLKILEEGYSGSGNVSEEIMNDYIMRSDIGRSYMEGRITSSKFFYLTNRYFKLRMKYLDFYRVWNSIFYPCPGMENIVKKIRNDYPDIRLILVSDTNEAHFDFIRKEYNFLELMDHFVLSYEVGKMKPHPSIFKEAIRLSGKIAKEILYVDDRADLIKAARTMGLCAFRFTGYENLRKQLGTFDILV